MMGLKGLTSSILNDDNYWSFSNRRSSIKAKAKFLAFGDEQNCSKCGAFNLVRERNEGVDLPDYAIKLTEDIQRVEVSP